MTMDEYEKELQVECDADRELQWVEVPYEQLAQDTLRNVIGEFVTREWEEIGDGTYTLDQKIDQVLSQLRNRKAKLVFDLTSNTCNIIPVP
jgi:uncharacterized protein YheU (UPF0270 family)